MLGGGYSFWDRFLGWGWLVPQSSGGGCPKKGDLAELRFLGERGGGAEQKEVTSDVILVSNYHGCKEEAINLIPEYLIDIIHKLL